MTTGTLHAIGAVTIEEGTHPVIAAVIRLESHQLRSLAHLIGRPVTITPVQEGADE